MEKLKLIKYADLQSVHEIRESDIVEDVNNVLSMMVVRGGGDFKHKSVFLNPDYDYVLGKDNEDVTILVPLKKKTDCCK